MKRKQFEVQVISSPGELLEQFCIRQQIPSHSVTMLRKISPIQDLVAIFSLCRILLKSKPEIVHAHTPKAGLLGMIAAWLSGVPIRIYQFEGLPLTTARGLQRWFLRCAEKISCKLAHQVLCVSNSLRNDILKEGLCDAEKLSVLGVGSVNGVDALNRFNLANICPKEKTLIRSSLGISPNTQIIGFIGRIVRDKGILELIATWETLRGEFPDLQLLMIGGLDTRDSVPKSTIDFLHKDPRIHMIGQTQKMREFYSAIDVCVLPTYREGLPNVLLEAAAMECPVVATRVTGCVDAVNDGKTGLLIPARDPEALASALKTYLTDPLKRRSHGKAGRCWVQEKFSQEGVWNALHTEYLRLAEQHGLALEDPAKSKRSAA